MTKHAKKTRICENCGKPFLGATQQLYCSNECYKVARNARRSTNTKLRARDNSKLFMNLLKYVEENNLKELLEKYKPVTLELEVAQ